VIAPSHALSAAQPSVALALAFTDRLRHRNLDPEDVGRALQRFDFSDAHRAVQIQKLQRLNEQVSGLADERRKRGGHQCTMTHPEQGTKAVLAARSVQAARSGQRKSFSQHRWQISARQQYDSSARIPGAMRVPQPRHEAMPQVYLVSRLRQAGPSHRVREDNP